MKSDWLPQLPLLSWIINLHCSSFEVKVNSINKCLSLIYNWNYSKVKLIFIRLYSFIKGFNFFTLIGKLSYISLCSLYHGLCWILWGFLHFITAFSFFWNSSCFKGPIISFHIMLRACFWGSAVLTLISVRQLFTSRQRQKIQDHGWFVLYLEMFPLLIVVCTQN